MHYRRLAFALMSGALAAPAFAYGLIHNANTEVGYTVHPAHAQPSRSRAEVTAEIEQAKRDGTWAALRVGGALPAKSSGSGLTRAQVLADLERAQQHPSWNARRTGAPVTMP
ncbi:MAG: DUF4148 domain-containing protein [Burkholderiales bacterium]|nr:DUF4148 domain-containing protein [Burkholderiales bacterium]